MRNISEIEFKSQSDRRVTVKTLVDSVRRLGAVCVLVALPAASTVALAQPQPSPLFKDAYLPLGLKLMAEHKCAECHARRVGGDGSAIYRPLGKVNTPGLLRGMVDYCSTELNMGLFPEEVTAVAAVLDRDHYRFAQRKPQK